MVHRCLGWLAHKKAERPKTPRLLSVFRLRFSSRNHHIQIKLVVDRFVAQVFKEIAGAVLDVKIRAVDF